MSAANFPVVLLVGKAGSGKDTVGQILAKHFNGQCIALADEMKRVLHHDMRVEQGVLWGPSELRNTPMGRCSGIRDPGMDKFGRRSTQDVLYRDAALERLRYAHDHLDLLAAGAFTEWFDKEVVTDNTVRHVLQTMGTEWGRKYDPNIWIDIALQNAEEVLAGKSYTARDGVQPPNGTFKDTVIITDGRFRNEVLAVRKMGGAVVKLINPDETSTATHASEVEQDSIPDHWFDLTFYNNKKNGLALLEQDISYYGRALLFRRPPLNLVGWTGYLGPRTP